MSEAFEKGLELKNEGKFEEAEPFFIKDLSENPGVTRSLIHLGSIYNHMNHWKKMKEVYNRLVALNPSDENYYKLGEAYYLNGETIHAVDSFKLSLQSNEQYVLSHLALASLFGNAGNDYKKEHYLKNALSIDDTIVDIYEELIQLYFKNFRYDEAFLLTEKYIALSPKDKKIKILQIELLIRMGKFNTARVWINDMMSNDIRMKKALEDKVLVQNRNKLLELVKTKQKEYKKSMESGEPEPAKSKELAILYFLIGDVSESSKYLVYARQISERKKMSGDNS